MEEFAIITLHVQDMEFSLSFSEQFENLKADFRVDPLYMLTVASV